MEKKKTEEYDEDINEQNFCSSRIDKDTQKNLSEKIAAGLCLLLFFFVN